MPRDLWTKKAVEQATKPFNDGVSKKDVQLSTKILDNLTKQLADMVYLGPDEKIMQFDHCHSMVVKGKRYKDGGDLIATSNKLLFALHPITKVKKGWFSSEKTVHHDRYVKPIALKVQFDDLKKVYASDYGYSFRSLCIDYLDRSDDVVYSAELRYYGDNSVAWMHNMKKIMDIEMELKKVVDAYKYTERRPKPIEVVHKGTVVNVNIDSKGFLLNVEPCPTCGANLFLSQDRKTAYCRYCNKEIPTVEQLREN